MRSDYTLETQAGRQRPGFVTLRQEPFGGLAFDHRTGVTEELNHSAFYLLHQLVRGRSLDTIRAGMTSLFGVEPPLVELDRFAKKVPVCPQNTRTTAFDIALWQQRQQHLSAPESVHVGITSRCNQECSGCYAAYSTSRPDLSTERLFHLLDELSRLGVYQWSIGGGEPLLFPDLFAVVRYAHRLGITSTLTTNGTLIDRSLAQRIAQSPLMQVQVSLDGHLPELHNSQRQASSFHSVLAGIGQLRDQGQRFGVNVLLSRDNAPLLPKIVPFVFALGASDIVLLRPKPSLRNPRWLEDHDLTAVQYQKLTKTVTRLGRLFPLRVDTSLSFIFAGLSPAQHKSQAIYGCSAGTRLCSINPAGEVYPCSHLQLPSYRAGCVGLDDLAGLWQNADAFCAFRSVPELLAGKCGRCQVKKHCWGCRLLALQQGDFYGEEHNCPL